MSLLDNTPLFYPEQRHHIWQYCIYLGPYTHKERNYDLGIYIDPNNYVSAAIVYGNDPSEYISGPIDCISTWKVLPYYYETYKRAMALNLHPTMNGGCIGGLEDLRKEYKRLKGIFSSYSKQADLASTSFLNIIKDQINKIEEDFARFNIKLI